MEKTHQALSEEIKKVHRDLRVRSRKVGASKAWEEHCESTEVLENYAKSMKSLAESYWSDNNTDATRCRITWVVDHAEEYFNRGGRSLAVAKEEKLVKTFLGPVKCSLCPADEKPPFLLLDVGSCYNPFKKYDIFKVIALDLAPASQDVLKCDFLNVKLGSQNIFRDNTCEELESESFDIIVFSLVLEYLPAPSQRLLLCQKAYSLLRHNGVVFILTPDSKHATANSKIMKMWRHALALLGFWRVYYEKQRHLHCMMFRKCCWPEASKTWAERQREDWPPLDEMMRIPQDFNEFEGSCDKVEFEVKRDEIDSQQLTDCFKSLPFDSCTE